MSAIPRLIDSTMDDFGLLARQYAQLTGIKLKKVSRYGLVGMVMFGSATILLMIVFAELIFSLSAYIVEHQQLAKITLISAGMTTLLAVVFAVIGSAAMKKIDMDPRASAGLPTPNIDLPFKQLKPRGL